MRKTTEMHPVISDREAIEWAVSLLEIHEGVKANENSQYWLSRLKAINPRKRKRRSLLSEDTQHLLGSGPPIPVRNLAEAQGLYLKRRTELRAPSTAQSGTPICDRNEVEIIPSRDPNYDGPYQWVESHVARDLERRALAAEADRTAYREEVEQKEAERWADRFDFLHRDFNADSSGTDSGDLLDMVETEVRQVIRKSGEFGTTYFNACITILAPLWEAGFDRKLEAEPQHCANIIKSLIDRSALLQAELTRLRAAAGEGKA